MRLALHVLVAIAWGVIVQWPWGVYVFHATAALGILHVLSPWWCHFVFARPFHRAFVVGPFALFVLDAGFLLYAWTNDLWRELTLIAVAILGICAVLSLLYSLLVMTLLDHARTKRQSKRDPKS